MAGCCGSNAPVLSYLAAVTLLGSRRKCLEERNRKDGAFEMFIAAKELCDVLISYQVTDKASGDYGAISCPGHEKVHARVGEALFPFCHLYSETGEEKYLQSALRLLRWLSSTQKDDGSWEPECSDVGPLATVSLMQALCHSHQLIAGEIPAEERTTLKGAIRRAAEHVYENASEKWAESHGPGVNCLAASSPALQFAYAVTGEQKYRKRAGENALSVIERINDDGFFVGERVIAAGGNPSVDVAFTLEVGLPALTVYSCLSGNTQVRDAVLRALEAHLNFITPSGYIDNSWGARMYQWILLGNEKGNGCQTAFLALRNFDTRFQRAAGKNLRFMLKNMMKDGLVTTGPSAKDKRDYVPCILSTALRANAVCQTLVYSCGVPICREGKSILPTEEKGWVRFHRSVNVLQIRTSALLCTISGDGAGDIGGGTISHLWNERFGTVQAASAYPFGPHGLNDASQRKCLAPRIEAVINDQVCTNIFDPDTSISVSQDTIVEDKLEVLVNGKLRWPEREDAGPGYTIKYRFDVGRIEKEIAVDRTEHVTLRSIEPVVCSRGCDFLRVRNGIEIKHPRGSSCIVEATAESARIQGGEREDVIWSAFPAMHALPIVVEPPRTGGDPCKMEYTIELHDWE